jgi:hypothetical protein
VFIHINISDLEELLSQLMTKKSIELKIDYSFTNLHSNQFYQQLRELISVLLLPDEIITIKKIFDFCFNSITDTEFLDLIIFSIIENSGLNLEEETENEGFDVDDEEEDDHKDHTRLLLTLLETKGFKIKRIK